MLTVSVIVNWDHHIAHLAFVPLSHLAKKDVSVDSFVPNDRNSRNTLHTPEPKTAWRKFFLKTWSTLSLLKQQKVRYATKCSIAATLLAAPAFMESTSEWFRTWRMEWALITVSSKMAYLMIMYQSDLYVMCS